MTPMTIAGQIVNGHFQHEKPLAGLEGQHVIATLTMAPKESPNGKAEPLKEAAPTPPTASLATEEEFDPEPPEWLQVEKDLYFPMPVPEILLETRELIVEEGKPCIVLPDELPDE